MGLVTSTLRRLARTGYVRDALSRPGRPAALRRRPTRTEWVGLWLVAFSYVIGWPAVAAFAYLAYRLHEPLVLGIGGPAIYGTSHVVFWLGLYLAGAEYVRALLRLGTRRAYERFLPEAVPVAPADEDPRARGG